MNCLSRIAMGLALMGLLSAGLATGADDDKVPSISTIMKKANGGPKGLCAMVGMDLKAKEPDWDKIQKETKELAACIAFLPKNKAPKPIKGDAEQWDKFCKDYVDVSKTLLAAVDKKEQKDAQAAHKKMVSSCGSCHMAFRMKK
jgi:cytochrome c556